MRDDMKRRTMPWENGEKIDEATFREQRKLFLKNLLDTGLLKPDWPAIIGEQIELLFQGNQQAGKFLEDVFQTKQWLLKLNGKDVP